MLYRFPPETPLLSSYNLSAGLQVALPPRPRTYVQMQSKVHKPPLKVNHFSAFLTTNFRDVRRIISSRRDASRAVRHAELGSASRYQQGKVLKRVQHDTSRILYFRFVLKQHMASSKDQTLRQRCAVKGQRREDHRVEESEWISFISITSTIFPTMQMLMTSLRGLTTISARSPSRSNSLAASPVSS